MIMFKSLKKKIEQGVAQSPIRNAFSSAEKSLETNAEQDAPLAASTPKKAEDPVSEPLVDVDAPGDADPAIGKLVDIPLQEGRGDVSGIYSDASLPTDGETTPVASRSRTSSISSITSDSSIFTNVSFAHHHYQMPSDIESEVEESGALDGYSKEDLYNILRRYERRSSKYKNKFMELVAVYKDMVQERDKFKNTLTNSQDRAFKRISELKEQIQLNILAKQDLEENYRMMLEEKDEHVIVLKMQVNLLKEGKEIPPELQEKVRPKSRAKKVNPEGEKPEGNTKILKDKVHRLETLLTRCKETIKSSKEKNVHLMSEKESLQMQLEERDRELEKIRAVGSTDSISKLQNQMREARKIIEQLETDREIGIAEIKQQVHSEMEQKDSELVEMRLQLQPLQQENTELTEKVEKLEKSSQETLDKSREIIKRLKEEKVQLKEEIEAKLQTAEQNMEEEKICLVQEVSRGKTAAMSLLQEEIEKKMEEKLAESVAKRDHIWQDKMADQESAHHEELANQERCYKTALESKEKEKDTIIEQLVNERKKSEEVNSLLLAEKEEEIRRRLHEGEESMKLAVEEQQLQKMAAMSQQGTAMTELRNKLEDLTREKAEYENKIAKLTEDIELEQKKYDQRSNELKTNHKQHIATLTSEHQQKIDSLKQQCSTLLQEKMELITQKHSEQIDDMLRKHEESLQGSSLQIEDYYRAEVDAVKSNLEQLIQERSDQIEQLKNKLAEQENMCHKEHTETLERAKKDLQNEREESEKFRKEIENLTTRHESTVSDAQRHILELNLKLSEKENEIDKMKDLISDLEIQVERFKTDANEKCSNADLQMKDLYSKLCSVEDNKKQTDEENEKLKNVILEQDKLSELTISEKSQFLSQVQIKDSEIELMKAQMLNYQQDKEAFERDVNQNIEQAEKSLQEQMSVLQEQNSHYKHQLEIPEKELEEIQQKLIESHSLNEQLEQDNSLLQDRISLLQTSSKEIQEKCDSINVTLVKLMNENSELEQKGKSFELMLEETLKKNDDLNKRVKETQEIFNASQSQIKADRQILEDKLHSLQDELATRVEEVRTFTQSDKMKEEEIKALKLIIEEDSVHVESAEIEQSGFRKQLEEKDKAIGDVEKQLKLSKDKFNQLKIEAKTRIKELRDSLEETSQKHVVAITDKEKSLTDRLEQEKEKLVSHHAEEVGILRTHLYEEQTKTMTMEESFRAKFEEKQNRYKDNFSKMKEKFQEKMKEREMEFEERILNLMNEKDASINEEIQRQKDELMDKQTELWEVKLKDLSAQHESEHSAKITELSEINETNLNSLRRENEKLSDDLSSQISSSTTEIALFQEKLEEAQSKIQKILDLRDNLESEKNDKEQESERFLTELETKLSEVTRQLDSVTEKHKHEINEKDAQLSQSIRRIEELQNTNNSMEGMLKAVSESCQNKDEKMRSLLDEHEEIIMQTRSNCEKTVTEREEHLSSLQNQIDKMKSEQDSEVERIKQEHVNSMHQIKDSYEKCIANMSMNDTVLQSKLKQLNDKVTSTEERLQECKQIYEAQIEQYKAKSDTRGAAAVAENETLQQRLSKIESEIREISEKNVQITDEHRTEKESLEKSFAIKYQELKQKYMTKLKEMQTEKVVEMEKQLSGEDVKQQEKINKLISLLQTETSEKEAVSSELTFANTKLLQLEETSGASRSCIMELESKVTELDSEIKDKEIDIEKLKKLLKEERIKLETTSGELQEAGLKLTVMNDECASKLDQQEKKAVEEGFALENKISNLESELETWQTRARKSEDYCVELEERLTESRNGVQELQVKLNEHALQNEKLRQNCDTLTSDKQASIQQLEARLSQSNDISCHFETKLSDSHKINEELENKIFELNSHKNEMDKRLEEIKVKYEKDIQDAHSKSESESSQKIVEYKKKAENYIAQLKKQNKEETDELIAQHKISCDKLQSEILTVQSDYSSLSKEKDELVAMFEKDVQNMHSLHEEELKGQERLVQEAIQKSESSTSVESELVQILEKHKGEIVEKNKELVQLMSDYDQLKETLKNQEAHAERNVTKLEKDIVKLKQDKDMELDILEQQHSEDLGKTKLHYQDLLEDGNNDHMSKIKHLVNEFNQKLANKDKEFESTFSETLDRGSKGEQRLLVEHHTEVEELHKEIQEKDDKIEALQEEYETKLKRGVDEERKKVLDLQNQLTSLQQQQQVLLWDAEEKKKRLHQKALESRETMHMEKITVLTSEWNKERKQENWSSGNPSKELVNNNQIAINVLQNDTTSQDLLEQHVVGLAKQIEELKEKHRLELAEMKVQHETKNDTMPKPIVLPKPKLNMDPNSPNFVEDVENLEMYNMDLQAQAIQMNGELTQCKLRERQLQKKVEDLWGKLQHLQPDSPPLSPGGYHNTSFSGPLLTESTQFEYLRNILYQYMVGKETKTLARVLSTIVNFSEEQNHHIMLKEEAKSTMWMTH